MMTRNDAVALQLFCVMMTFSDALPVLSTKNDGHCHHSRMGVFPDYYLKIIGWPARLGTGRLPQVKGRHTPMNLRMPRELGNYLRGDPFRSSLRRLGEVRT